MPRFQWLSDAQWSLIEGMLPRPTGRPGRIFSDARTMLEGIIYRYRFGITLVGVGGLDDRSPSHETSKAIGSGGSRGGRPVAIDADECRSRNGIERRFCHTKQWRGLATR